MSTEKNIKPIAHDVGNELLVQLRKGDKSSATGLWNLVEGQLCGYCHSELRGCRYSGIDQAEAIASQAFFNCEERIAIGEFPDVTDYEAFRALLFHDARLRLASAIRKGRSERPHRIRESDVADDASLLNSAAKQSTSNPIDDADEVLVLLSRLTTEERMIAELLRSGLRIQEIAVRLGCSRQTIYKKLSKIQSKAEVLRNGILNARPRSGPHEGK